MKESSARRPIEFSKNYQSFDQLDGDHPWIKVVPNGAVTYQARELRSGEIIYFNYELAREMGLIDLQHPKAMNPDLKEKLLATFSLQIINEYDIQKQTKFDPATIKPGRYMATRYLQLQHNSRTGKTSGDGRGIWNGVVTHKSKTWDVSSRGTGVTCLSPGAVEANKPLKTGSVDYGYGCGQAEIDELVASAIQSEIFHNNGIHTERVLCVIDLGGGVGIGVRAHMNLIRPAHLFPFLKQERRAELKAACDYLIERQNKNRRWQIGQQKKYDQMLSQMGSQFGRFVAQLESDYVFAWLDWDGDNVLADAGIIDYGSIRQFGLRHDQYRYDDVERFSTALPEQKKKARLLIQVLAQAVDFIKTGKRLPLSRYENHDSVKLYDKSFNQAKIEFWLEKVGFSESQIEKVKLKSKLVQQCMESFELLEKVKVTEGPKKVPDGINHAALFDLRAALRDLPAYLAKNGLASGGISPESLLINIASSRSRPKDIKNLKRHLAAVQEFQKSYIRLLRMAQGKEAEKSFLNRLAERARLHNREDRLTGNALIQITNTLLESRRKGLTANEMQSILDLLISKYKSKSTEFTTNDLKVVPNPALLDTLLELIHEHRHDI